MKQTAVEWLEFRYKNNITLYQGDFEQAKEMEKQQDKTNFTPDELRDILKVIYKNRQQKRSYSEEEVKQAFIDGSNTPIEEDDAYGTEFFKYMDEWLEQFKKK